MKEYAAGCLALDARKVYKVYTLANINSHHIPLILVAAVALALLLPDWLQLDFFTLEDVQK